MSLKGSKMIVLNKSKITPTVKPSNLKGKRISQIIG